MIPSTLVVNLFAGPGAGKSTIAAHLFAELKWRGIEAELALEYAKEKVWEDAPRLYFQTQPYLFAEQLMRIKRLQGKVEVVVTDSPLLLCIVYDAQHSEALKQVILEAHRQFQNWNFFLGRLKDYHTGGRIHTEDEARLLDKQILALLQEQEVPFEVLEGTRQTVDLLTQRVVEWVERARLSGKLQEDEVGESGRNLSQVL